MPALTERFERELCGTSVYGVGEEGVLDGRTVCVHGARRATPYGMALASMAGRVIAENGLVLLTTASMGCCAQAARACREAGGRYAVVAFAGADVVYPRQSEDVFRDAACVVSTRPYGTPALPANVQVRNALLAEMSDVAILCEAGLMSGVLAMADMMGDKPVLAFPGSVLSPQSKGTNEAILRGAYPVLSEEHLDRTLCEVFGIERRVPTYGRGTPEEMPGGMEASLAASPMTPQELVDAHVVPDALTALRELAGLEAAGKVERLPDGRYSLTQRYIEQGFVQAAKKGSRGKGTRL